MNIETGREFDFQNPQDVPYIYVNPPPGFEHMTLKLLEHAYGGPLAVWHESPSVYLPGSNDEKKRISMELKEFLAANIDQTKN